MDLQRDYYQCDVCKLVFVPPGQRLAPETELKRYQLHENDPDDPRYRKFLSRLFIPMNERIKPASKGLDFGSGPGPTLSVMFEEAGHAVRLFDIFFENDPSVFEEEYDFITSSET
ncbi:MAG: methyltransferase domain-containing protein, partial [Balneolaceae bacterium]